MSDVYMSIKLYLTLGEEHRLRMVENRVLRKLNRPKKEKEELYHVLLHDFYYPAIQVTKS
jgi:hypothetical protein